MCLLVLLAFGRVVLVVLSQVLRQLGGILGRSVAHVGQSSPPLGLLIVLLLGAHRLRESLAPTLRQGGL